MLKKQFTFVHLAHSDAMVDHTNAKLERLERVLADEPEPRNLGIRFKSASHGVQDEAELNLSTKNFRTVISCVDKNIYNAIDEAAEKLYRWVLNEKDRLKEHHKNHRSEKKDFQRGD